MIKDHLFLDRSTKPTSRAIQTASGISYPYYKKVFGLTEIFSRDILALIPLAFQRAMFVGKYRGDSLDILNYQHLCLVG